MFTNNEISVINISDLSEKQLKHFEESHKKWVESTRNTPIQFYDEKYYEEETDSPKFFNEKSFVIVN